jgi:ketosteroid isomerase-like protein
MSIGESLKIFLVLTCLPSMILACNINVDTEKELENLLLTDREFSTFSVEHGAAEAFNTYLLKDAFLLRPGQNPLQGRDKIFVEMLQTGTGYTLSWEPQSGEVASSGDLGYTWGVFTLSMQDDSGDVQKRSGKYLNIWKKDDSGNWRVKVDIGNQNPS